MSGASSTTLSFLTDLFQKGYRFPLRALPARWGPRKSPGPSRPPPQEPAIPRETSLLLLRIAAFLIDAITAAVLLIPPASVVSYSLLWLGLSMRPVSWIWWTALLVFVVFILFRDGRGRSMGKRVMAVELRSRSGARVGWLRSAARNLPLVVPGWNLVEVVMILGAAGGRRSGDRMAGTMVVEE